MKSSHLSVYFNNILVSSASVHRHLEMLRNDKLSCRHHLKSVLNKVKKTKGLLRKFQQILPRKSLITIYKSFIRLIKIMAILFMIEPLINHFTKIMNLFNITQP